MKILFINSYLFISYLFNFIDIENTLFYFLIMQIFEICFLVRVVVFVFVCLVGFVFLATVSSSLKLYLWELLEVNVSFLR